MRSTPPRLRAGRRMAESNSEIARLRDEVTALKAGLDLGMKTQNELITLVKNLTKERDKQRGLAEAYLKAAANWERRAKIAEAKIKVRKDER